MSEIKNAVGYIRVSTSMQIHGFSLDAQLDAIKEYCVKNNYNLLRYYEDAGISGTKFEERPELQKMLNDIVRNKNKDNIDTIIVWKLSRLSRNMIDLAKIIEFLYKENINLICISEGIDTNNSLGKGFLYMTGIFAEMERDSIVENCKLGMKERALSGKWNGGRVFGYRSNEEKELIINEDEAIIVKEIFNLFVKGWGYKKITNYLNNKNLKTLRGSNWSINSIKQIITNPIYAGYIRWGQYQNWSTKRRKGRQEEYIYTIGTHTPIITKDIWEKSQIIHEQKNKISEKIYEGEFLLSGLLRCPKCGATMISHRIKKPNKSGEYYRYYQCSNFFNKGSSVCSSNLIVAELAEKVVIDKINSIVNSPEVLNAIIKRIEKQNSIDISPLEKKMKNLQDELEKIKKKKNETLELEFENKIDINTLKERLNFLSNKENEIIQKINIVENELNKLNSHSKINPELIKTVLENFCKVFEKADIEKKKILLKSLIESITITDGKTTKERKVDKIKLYFEPEDIQALNSRKNFATTYGTVHRL
ncbi:recombinase family protein [Thermobrachium celere]|uniref:recombinase family protein n=1 Tax=Thermobrachium celere TaxID=53422 RepID=UPI0019407F3A|nr:recombinase family protein [Thermobrachium celere]GFR36264.1 recombinase RecB [Thermobrachium celere]